MEYYIYVDNRTQLITGSCFDAILISLYVFTGSGDSRLSSYTGEAHDLRLNKDLQICRTTSHNVILFVSLYYENGMLECWFNNTKLKVPFMGTLDMGTHAVF